MELAIGNGAMEIGGSGESAAAATLRCPGMVAARAAHASIGTTTARITGATAVAAVRTASRAISAAVIAAVGATMVATAGKSAAMRSPATKATAAVAASTTMLGLSRD